MVSRQSGEVMLSLLAVNWFTKLLVKEIGGDNLWTWLVELDNWLALGHGKDFLKYRKNKIGLIECSLSFNSSPVTNNLEKLMPEKLSTAKQNWHKSYRTNSVKERGR